MLILSNGVLTAYDTEEKKLIWRCASLVITQLFVGHGVVINSDNGIYEIDIVDGGYRCLQQFQKDRIQCIVGRTSEKIVFCYMNQQELLNGLILKWGVVIVMFLYKILVRHWIVFSAMRTKTFCMVFPEQRFIHGMDGLGR